MRNLLLSAAIAALTCSTTTAMAEDAALLLGMERYEQLGRLSWGQSVTRGAEALEAMGFATVAVPNGRRPAVTQALAEWLSHVPQAERLVVGLSGRFVTDGSRTWLLTAEARAPGLLGLRNQAVSLDSLLLVLASRPGAAVLVLGVSDDDADYDGYLHAGIGDLDIPQGVLVVQGEVRQIGDFLAQGFARPGADLMQTLRAMRRVEQAGYQPREMFFMPDAPVPRVTPRQLQNFAAEDALWQGAVALDRLPAYRNYLARYPQGRHIVAAEEAIAAIIAEPNRAARLAEEALELSRDARRDIQRNLTLLAYNTRGIDGIFGPGTRRAITNWQQQNGYGQTSYLTPAQINRLEAQAARKAAELEAQAVRQAALEAARDRAFWRETGARGDEPGLRVYLERYPDGIHAEAAVLQLAQIEDASRRVAAAADRAAWDHARERDTIPAYETYLRSMRNGAFRGAAQARIAELSGAADRAEMLAAAAIKEEALNLNSLSRRLVEARLERLELEPGLVDGVFNGPTRRAIRRFQRARELQVTGYLDEDTLVRLLAEGVLRQ
ncbi:MAG: peptidoglycan-binding protein [Rhodobacteraceae bacterium]|nr:peptidoglycan-binding protein [Paracoccaceae bacterium]